MNVIYGLSLFFAFFPYVSFVYTGTDVQPYLLIVNIILFLILLSQHKIDKNNKIIYLFIAPIILSLMLIFFSINIFSGLRSLYGYLNIFISFIVFIYIIKIKENLFLKFLSISIYIWFIIGFIQTFFIRDFLFQILPRNLEKLTISETRGVQGLAAEPTFYGIVCVFFILILIAIPSRKIKNKNKLILLSLVSIIIFAKSSMAILFLILLLFIYTIVNFFSLKIFKYMILSGFTLIALYLITTKSFDNIRFIKLLKIFIEHPLEIATIDASMNDRVSAIYFSIKGFISNYGLPHTYGDYSSFLLKEVPKSSYFWYITINDRIKSFYGSILFELGVFGLIYIYGISYLIYLRFKKEFKIFITMFLFVNAILFTAIPLSISFVPLYMSVLYNYRAKEKK